MWVIGYLAFPLSTTLAAILNVGILYALLPRKVGAMELGPLAAYAGKLAAASAAGGAVAWLGNRLVAGELGVSFLATAASLAVAGLAGLAVFFAASRLLGIKETSDYLRRFLREVRRGQTFKGLTPSFPRLIIVFPSWPVGRRRVTPGKLKSERALVERRS